MGKMSDLDIMMQNGDTEQEDFETQKSLEAKPLPFVRVQTENYAIFGRPVNGWSEGTNGARFVFHIGRTAFLFGRGSKKALVVELLTTGFLFRCRFVATE